MSSPCGDDNGGGDDGGSDLEIFLYDGMTVNQLTRNTAEETSPEISGTTLVWQNTTAGGDASYAEIYLGQFIDSAQGAAPWDADGNRQVGLPDAIHALRVAAGQ